MRIAIMKSFLARTPWTRRFPAAALLLAVWAAGVSNSAPAQAPDEAAAAAKFAMPGKDSPGLCLVAGFDESPTSGMEWWRDARFGMFIHWGVYSSLGNEYKGRKGGTYAEHIMRILKIPIAEYRAEVAGHFYPSNFNADTWVSLAKQAGMEYIVITSKHHDGFAMWPTKVNDYNVMDATPWHHDPMQDLSAACQRQGSSSASIIRRRWIGAIPTPPATTGNFTIPSVQQLVGNAPGVRGQGPQIRGRKGHSASAGADSQLRPGYSLV